MFQVGALLAGKYRVERVLGQGGMGVVVAALHVHLNQRVALKFLLPEMLENRDIAERFLREARALAQLRGEHVCRVSDVGTLDTGAPYIVMELLDGSDLATQLAHHGPLAVAVAVDHVLQACLGLGEAHSLGVVHRDLKPANLFLTRRPDGSALIKVLDFGIAKAPRDAGVNLTRTASVLGSPGYMSPEQLRSTRDCDVRSDIWAIGIILYELVSGCPPFSGESITEIALHIAMDPTPPLAVESLPPGFEQVVQRCLAKDPAHRYPDLASLAHALVPYGGYSAREIAAGVTRLLQATPGDHDMRMLASTANVTPTTLGSAVGVSSRVRPPAGSRRTFAVMVAGLGVVMIGIVIAVAMSHSRSTDNSARPNWAHDPGDVPLANVPDGPAQSASASRPRSADVTPVNIAPADVASANAAPPDAMPSNAAPSNAAPSNTTSDAPAGLPALSQPGNPAQPGTRRSPASPGKRTDSTNAGKRINLSKPEEDLGNDRL